MAQKKRGLGRGLQALIPEAQAEDPAQRPSDVFFPSAREDGQEAAAGSSASNAEAIASLLAPSKRTRSSRRGTKAATEDRRSGTRSTSSRGTRAASSRSTSKVKAENGGETVSRETRRSRPEDESSASSSAVSVAEGEAVENSAVTEPDEAARVAEERADDREERVSESSQSVVSRETPQTELRDAESEDDDGTQLVPVPGATFAELDVELIVPNPRQPRQVFDEEDIAELADSIREVGLLQPIVVRRVDDADGEAERYELIMGERRLRAAREAGLETIPSIVRYTEDQDLLRDALLENLHRVQLNPLEEAAAYQQLLEDFNCTHQELSKRIARSRSQISNTLRLMKLPPLVQRRLAAGVVSAGHARALLGLPDAAAMERLAQRIVAEGLSVRATEELVALHEDPDDARPVRPLRARSTALPALSTRLSDAFDTRVKVTRGAKKGRITIEFAGEEDLARIVETLAPGTSLLED